MSNTLLPGRAAIFHQPGQPLEMTHRSVPTLQSGEILVSVFYTTLCGSNIHTYTSRRQEPPSVVLGHEIVGDVMQVDPNHSVLDLRGKTVYPGDRVIWSIFSAPSLSDADPLDIVKVGDSIIHIEEGDNAGCGTTVGITSCAHTLAQLTQAFPDHIIDDLLELIPLIELLTQGQELAA